MDIIVGGIFAVFHYFLSIQIDYMITISALGFKSECPLRYLTSPGIYHWTNRFLGLALISSALIEDINNIIYTLLVWFVIWLASGKYGKVKAYAKYREIMIDMYEHAEDDDERKTLKRESEMSDKELEEQVDRQIRISK